MKNLLVRGVAALAACLVVSCVSSTPASRIAANPGLYQQLPEKQRDLVNHGMLERGMSPEAVWLAWGEPSRRFEGWADGKATLRWDYFGARPVYSTTFAGSVGWGYRHGGGYYSSYGLCPEVAYVPYHCASAWFVNNKLEAWSCAR